MSVSPYLRSVPRSFAQAAESRQRQHALTDYCTHEYKDAMVSLATIRRSAAHGLDARTAQEINNYCDDIESNFRAHKAALESAITGIGE